MSKVAAIIPAAGQGKRMGVSGSKVYLEVWGRPLLAYTLERFQSHSLIAEIIVLVRKEDLEYCQQEVVEKYGFDKVRKVLSGGPERQDSIRLGLAALAPDIDLVLVHDGARPLVDSQTISLAIETALEKGAAVTGVPVKDTIKVVDVDLLVKDTPERQTLWAAQTPQAFKRAILERAYQEAGNQGWTGTDDASLVEKSGCRVYMVRGSYDNIKVTTPEDLLYVRERLRGE